MSTQTNDNNPHSNHPNLFQQFRITARGLIIENEQILFVSDEGQYWYTPGGRLEPGESLQACVGREVFEETGLLVTVGPLLYVQESLDIKDSTHKIHFYFHTTVKEGKVSDHWFDAGGAVRYRQFFGYDAIKDNKNIIPRFFAELDWDGSLSLRDNIFKNLPQSHAFYQGCILSRGFEFLEKLDQKEVSK